jgi:TIR domain
MTTIFVSFAKEDAACAEEILQGLEAKGYSAWREPKSLELSSILYPRTIENVILSSAAVVLVWSSSAFRSEWVERHIHFAQRLKKPILPVLIDGTDLPNTLIADKTIAGRLPCTDVVTHILPLLPPPDKPDPLIQLAEKAADDLIAVRKEAINAAAGMLQSGEQREAVLAILEYLAHNDLMMGVRDKAQEVLDADARKAAAPPPFLHLADSRHIFGVRCKNGHVTYFDKRRVCSAYKEVPRDIRHSAGLELDELHLKCETCGEDIVASVDCRDYRSHK